MNTPTDASQVPPPPRTPRALIERFRARRDARPTQIVPQARMAGPMPWVIAIMVLLTVIAAAGGLALTNAARQASADLSGGITVQVVSASPEDRARQANAALAVLQRSADVATVRLLPAAEVDALVEPWLGQRSDDPEAENAIPVPALIDAQLRGAASEARLETLRVALAKIAPDARVDAQAEWLQPVFAALGALRWLALALIVLLGLATSAAVLLAARTALGNNRNTIEIVHLLGGTDRQIARIFQRSIAVDAALGGAAGMALAIIVIVVLAGQFAALGSGMVTAGGLHWYDWIVLALIPLAGTALAATTARLAVLSALRKML